MDLDKIRESFKWKKSNAYCAKRLGISIGKYVHLKKLIKGKGDLPEQHYNLDKGESTITGVSKSEPKSAEEIIKLLNIDTSKWKLSQYWNKQMADHWRISALITKIKETESDHLKELLDAWKPKKYTIPKLSTPKGYTLHPDRDVVCGIMSLQDIHFGKEGNDT